MIPFGGRRKAHGYWGFRLPGSRKPQKFEPGGNFGLFYFTVLCSYAKFRTSYRRRREAIDALSSILWRYTSKDSIAILEQFFPEDGVKHDSVEDDSLLELTEEEMF